MAGKWIRISAQVGEWLKPADCKSAPPSEVRRFESFPVHQIEPFSGRERSRGPQHARFSRDGVGSGSPFARSRAFLARDLREIAVKRFGIALVAYAAIAVLALATLSDTRIRIATLAVLAIFALKTWVRRKDAMRPDGESGSEQ